MAGQVAAAVFDRFDALTRQDGSRIEIPPAMAADVVMAESGRRFDPLVIGVVQANRELLLRVRQRFNEQYVSPEGRTRFNLKPPLDAAV